MAETGAANAIEAEIATAFGPVRAHRQSWSAPIDMVRTSPDHWLQLSLLPATGTERSCFPERWPAHRFEPIGRIFLIPARQPIHVRSESRAQRCITCAFPPARLAEWLGVGADWSDAWLSGSLDLASPTIGALLLRAGRELCAPGLASDALIELLAGQIAIELGRHFRCLEEQPAAGGLAGWQLRAIDERIAAGAGGWPGLADLAATVGLSVHQLARGFRASRGRAIGAALAEARVVQARRRLRSGDGVKAIAHDLGFAGASSFTAAFRRSTGETPAGYRRRLGREGG